MVFHDRPVYQEEHAAQLIMARRLHSPHKGRIHLRRSVDRPLAFPLQSGGEPYIFGNSVSTSGHPLIRVGDFSSKWKVTQWKSVNTGAFLRTYPFSFLV
jgi:hypothetical protein